MKRRTTFLPRSNVQMTRTRRLRAGKKVKAWESARRKIKKVFFQMGITSCELRLEDCMGDDGLGFAHTKKRRKLRSDELGEVALLCNNCHDRIEVLPPEEMERIVRSVISRRKEPA